MAATTPRVDDPLRLGRWRIVARLAEGSGTVVYRAHDGRGVQAAVKTVGRSGTAKDVARRLHHEGEALRRAAVDGVVRLREDGSEASAPYLALELVSGPSLAELVARRGRLAVGQVALLGALLADILAGVHRCGVVHGDLKPTNVLCPDRGPVLIDLDAATVLDRVASPIPDRVEPAGCVEAAGRGRRSARARHTADTADTADTAATADTADTADTVDMTIRATPSWLAPEQARGAAVSSATDVFGLGALLCFLATGASPFGRGPADAMLYRVVHEAPSLDVVPAELRPVLARCLAKEPGERPSAAALSRALLPDVHRLAA